MTLIEHILKKVQSKDSLKSKYTSPPPELDEASIERRVHKKRKKTFNRYTHVAARVDSSAPLLRPKCMFRHIEQWSRRAKTIHLQNFNLLTQIKRQHYKRGKVDCHWEHPLKHVKEYYKKRRDFLKQVQADNKVIYKRILDTTARVETTSFLDRCWQHNRQQIVKKAALPFVLFPPEPSEDVDPMFLAGPGVQRPRLRMSLRVVGGACLGWLTLELFTDVCPRTCRLFAELIQTDASHSYIGTRFFRKVPHLYWSGGDVVYDNGFGCYVQRGRLMPIGAENYHYPHSMPGLVSMRVTCDDEMCGIFNITFKPLPQFDLKNVVFARVVRPSKTYEMMESFGAALSTQPVVRIEAAHFVRGRGLLDELPPKTEKHSSLQLLEQTAQLLHSLTPTRPPASCYTSF